MKPPTGKQIGEDILLNHCSELLTDGQPKFKVFTPYLSPLSSVIPKSVIKNGVQAQLLWIYEVFRKGATIDPRASLPHEKIIEEMILHLRLPRKPPLYFADAEESLAFWAKIKKSRSNSKGGKASVKKRNKIISEIFFYRNSHG